MIGRLLGRIREALSPDGMSADDRARWAQAATLADVGELTAQWLEGDIASQPGYCGPVDTDEDLAPGMTATLIALNRAGMVTHQSQAGAAQYGQRAAVSGFATADCLDRIGTATAGDPALVVADLGEPDTARRAPVGWHHDEDDLADLWTGYGVCDPAAVAELADAVQVCIYDLEPGRNDRLWPALQRASIRTDEETDEP